MLCYRIVQFDNIEIIQQLTTEQNLGNRVIGISLGISKIVFLFLFLRVIYCIFAIIKTE